MIVCWFSCGAASAVAAKLAIVKYGKSNVRVVNNPVENEHEDNKRFLKDCEKWLGISIEFATNPCFPSKRIEDVFDEYGVMSTRSFAPCTLELKQNARMQWEYDNGFNKQTDIVVMGYTKGEENRMQGFKESKKNKEYNLECPLIDAGYDKQKCFQVIEEAGIKLPEIYTKYSFPNANCIGCVKSSSVWYWKLVKKNFPDVFKKRVEQSRKIGCRLIDLGKNKEPRHIFLDEMTDSMTGRKPKDCYVECGIFCSIGEHK